MTNLLSPLSRRILKAVTRPPDGLHDIDKALLVAVLDGDHDVAQIVLDELVQHGVVVEHQPGRYKILDLTAVTEDVPGPGMDDLKAVITWHVERAVLADRTIDPWANRLSDAHNIPGTSTFATAADAMEWFSANHNRLMALLDELIERDWAELCITLAEALVGLTHHSGHHRDQQRAAQHGLVAINRLHWDPEPATTQAEDDAREQRHNLRMAIFFARLAFARTSLHDHQGALDALTTAENHARKANDDRVVATVLSVRGRAHHAAGNLDAAENELRDALALDLAHGDNRRVALRRRRLGAVLAARGRHDAAFAELHQAAGAMRGLADPIGHARVLTVLGSAFIAANRPEEAFAPLVNALETMMHIGSPGYVADIYVELARASRATGATTAADEYYRDAITHYRRGHRDDTAAAIEAERAGQQ